MAKCESCGEEFRDLERKQKPEKLLCPNCQRIRLPDNRFPAAKGPPSPGPRSSSSGSKSIRELKEESRSVPRRSSGVSSGVKEPPTLPLYTMDHIYGYWVESEDTLCLSDDCWRSGKRCKGCRIGNWRDDVDYNNKDDGAFWHKEDKWEYQKYKLDRNKRKIVMRVGGDVGCGIATGAILAGITASSMGVGIGAGATGAALAYAGKKMERNVRALAGKVSGNVGLMRKVTTEKINRPPISNDALWRQLRTRDVDKDTINRMRFWIQKRRMSSWSYLCRIIIEHLNEHLKNQTTDVEHLCHAYRIANGELRFCLKEAIGFNSIINCFERNVVHYYLDAKSVTSALKTLDKDNLDTLTKWTRKEGVRPKEDKKGELTLNNILTGLDKWKPACGLDWPILPRDRRGTKEIAWFDRDSAGETMSMLAFEIVGDMIWGESMPGIFGQVAGSALDKGAGPAFGCLGIGLGLAILESVANVFVEKFNAAKEFEIMRNVGIAFEGAGVTPWDMLKSKNCLGLLKKVDVGTYLRYLELSVIAMRTLLKDGGMFEAMTDRFCGLIRYRSHRGLTSTKWGRKTLKQTPSGKRAFKEAYREYWSRINADELLELVSERMQYHVFALIYNNYLLTISCIVKLVNEYAEQRLSHPQARYLEQPWGIGEGFQDWRHGKLWSDAAIAMIKAENLLKGPKRAARPRTLNKSKMPPVPGRKPSKPDG